MVIDPHALFWWLEESGELPPRMRRRIEDELSGDGLTISAVTFWEMRLKERRGMIEPKTPVEGWPRVMGRTRFQSAPLVRGATLLQRRLRVVGRVSIRAPRERGDFLSDLPGLLLESFNPRPS